MSVIEKLASMQNRKDDVPNQELAKEIAKNKDSKAIKEIVESLYDKNKNIQSDCIKVLYEIGYIHPDLIQKYVGDFIELLGSRSNRLVWGSMIALSTIATLEANKIFENIDKILGTTKKGSVITVDNGIKTLAGVASVSDQYNGKIFPFLMEHLRTCRPKEIPQHAESIAVAVTKDNRSELLGVLEDRKDVLTTSQLKRVNKIIKSLSSKEANYGTI